MQKLRSGELGICPLFEELRLENVALDHRDLAINDILDSDEKEKKNIELERVTYPSCQILDKVSKEDSLRGISQWPNRCI
jgi:hypothetical protein